MSEHIFVCEFNEKLLLQLKRKAIAIKTNDYRLIGYINQEVSKENQLHVIIINLDEPLSSIQIKEEWKDIPVALIVHEIGNIKELLAKISFYKRLNIRVFLHPENKSSFTNLQILSSLQIPCGIVIAEDFNHWDSLNDLMHYSVYSRVNHAPIEPFQYIVSNYRARGYVDFNTVYFNNASKYLHLNEKGQVFLTEEDLKANKVFKNDIAGLENIIDDEKYQDCLNARYEVMLSMNECSFCESFRICLGKFHKTNDKQNSCKKFFSDMMETADYYLMLQNNKKVLWQL